MQNAWKVVWFDQGKKFKKSFIGDKPRESGAIDFGKKIKERGITQVHIVSKIRAFAPPATQRTAPEYGMIWCPYCLKWRFFVEKAVSQSGHLGPLLYRCPICTISIKDAYVRKYNEMMIIKLDTQIREKTPSEKQIRKTLRKK